MRPSLDQAPRPEIGAGSVLTVLMPHHECEQLAERSLKSIVAQTCRDWTLVVIDDCSSNPQRLRDLVQGLADPRILALRTTRNVGQFRIYNRLLPRIASPYLSFQDADDWSDPERFEVLLEQIRAHGCDALGSYLVKTDGRGRSLGEIRPPENVNGALRWRCRGGVVFGATMVCRVAFVTQLGGYDGRTRFGADTDFVYRAVFTGTVRNHPRPLYHYTVRTDSLTGSPVTGFGTPLRQAYRRQIRRRFWGNLWKKRLGWLRPADLLAAPNDLDFDLEPLG